MSSARTALGELPGGLPAGGGAVAAASAIAAPPVEAPVGPPAAAAAQLPPLPQAYESVFAPDPSKPARMPYGDAVRVLGTIAVVIGHVSDMHLYSERALTYNWWVLNFFDSAVRWAVPAYIMLSGALLLDPARKDTIGRFYKKRLMRIGIPLVFWSIFFLLFSVYYTGWVTPHQAWINLMMGKPYMHLHFIYRIAGLYAFTPMFRVFLRHSDRKMQVGTVILCFVIAGADSIMSSILKIELSAFARFAPFIAFYLCGYLLREAYVSRKVIIWCWIGYIVSVLVQAVGTGYLVKLFPAADGQIHGPPSVPMMLYDFLSPTRIAMGLCTWIILVNMFRGRYHHSARATWIMRNWASCTLGLYLIHPAFREIFYTWKGLGWLWPHHGVWTATMSPWLGIPLHTVVVYIPALILALILERIPYVRRIVG